MVCVICINAVVCVCGSCDLVLIVVAQPLSWTGYEEVLTGAEVSTLLTHGRLEGMDREEVGGRDDIPSAFLVQVHVRHRMPSPCVCDL